MPRPKHPDCVKDMPCRECGVLVMVSLYRSKDPRCMDCSVAALTSALKQLAGRSGPVYERWYAARWGNRAKEGRGGGSD